MTEGREDKRQLLRAGGVAIVALSLIVVSALAVSAARESRRTSTHVRASTELWNSYQQARASVVRELLLTQDFRLAGSPYFEERFAAAARKLDIALATVEQAGQPDDRGIARRVLAANKKIETAIIGLTDAVEM